MRLYSRIHNKGFAMAEVIVALFFVTIVVALVAGLGQQVSDFVKRSSQAAAVLELRGMTSTITRDPSTWLTKMRSSAHTSGLYAGCIPDPASDVSTFNCPAAMTQGELKNYDEELATIAGNEYFALSAPIIDYTGKLIAGTADAPVYLSNDGRICENNKQASCPFKSTGFFLRSKDATDSDPGSIKFVIKISKNYSPENTSPMKNQYLSIEIGELWKKADIFVGETCPSGTIKLGYLLTGQPNCVNVSDPCPSGQYAVGVNSNGKSICKSIPDCESNEFISLSNEGTDLICTAQANPCGNTNIFLGYFAGTGKPICSGLNIKCGAGKIQVGVSTNEEGQFSAQCVNNPPLSCPETNQEITFDGSAFVCQTASTGLACSTDKVMSGIDKNGEPICVNRSTASTSGTCPNTSDGKEQYLKGINPDGTFDCRPLPTGGGGGGVSAQEMCGALSGTWNSSTNKCLLSNVTNNNTTNVYNAIITPWSAPSPSVWSSTDSVAATKGPGVLKDEITWRRIGDTMHVKWTYRQNKAGTNGKGVTLIDIPNGARIDTTKLSFPSGEGKIEPQTPVGYFSRHYSNVAHCLGTVYAYNSTKLMLKALCAQSIGATAAAGWIPTYAGWAWADIAISLEASFPIQGWN